jgi:hypothetical protein
MASCGSWEAAVFGCGGEPPLTLLVVGLLDAEARVEGHDPPTRPGGPPDPQNQASSYAKTVGENGQIGADLLGVAATLMTLEPNQAAAYLTEQAPEFHLGESERLVLVFPDRSGARPSARRAPDEGGHRAHSGHRLWLRQERPLLRDRIAANGLDEAAPGTGVVVVVRAPSTRHELMGGLNYPRGVRGRPPRRLRLGLEHRSGPQRRRADGRRSSHLAPLPTK